MPNQFPEWLRRPWPSGNAAAEVRDLLAGLGLHTVCQSAHCPNHGECWARRTATLLVLGNVCTRNCAFCAVGHGRPLPPDPNEPAHAAEAVRRLGLKFVVITMVTRDDLADGGAAHVAATIQAIRAVNPGVGIEALVSDFGGDPASLAAVAEARPDIFSHNIETVQRLFPMLRDARYRYETSLEVLRNARTLLPDTPIKSGFMVGCGETPEEVQATLRDLRDAGCAAVSIGQYLQPTQTQVPVAEYIPPERFEDYRRYALEVGFRHAAAGAFVRSSYHAEELLQ